MTWGPTKVEQSFRAELSYPTTHAGFLSWQSSRHPLFDRGSRLSVGAAQMQASPRSAAGRASEAVCAAVALHGTAHSGQFRPRPAVKPGELWDSKKAHCRSSIYIP